MIALSFEHLDAELALPGGAVLNFRSGGVDVLRAGTLDAVRKDPRESACFPCVPYFGRIYGGVLEFGGERYRLGPTLTRCDPAIPLHGEGWIAEWGLVEGRKDAAVLRMTHDGTRPGGWPFPFIAEQRFQLARKGLHIVLSVTNIGHLPMPAGLGLHPYFPRCSMTRLTFRAAQCWTPPSGERASERVGEEAEETSSEVASKGGGAFSALSGPLATGAAAGLPADTLDHTFAGFAGAVTIEGARGRATIDSDAPSLHVYAPAGEAYVCLEPVSNLPGALTDPAGVHDLFPGRTRRIAMTVSDGPQ